MFFIVAYFKYSNKLYIHQNVTKKIVKVPLIANIVISEVIKKYKKLAKSTVNNNDIKNAIILFFTIIIS